MNDKFDIYYDSMTEASWFASLNPAFSLEKNNYHMIQKRGNNPEIIESITSYDKADIILLKGNKPLLVIEITSEVPTGHNVGQRFARLVRGVELGIPTIYYFPFDAKKHGEYSSMCNLNARLLKAAENMYKIHNTPLLCVNWLTDSDGELITDGTENLRMKSLMNSYVSSNFDKNCEEFKKQQAIMAAEYEKRVRAFPKYLELPDSVSKMRTSDFIRVYGIKNVPNTFIARPYTYVYKMVMTPDKCKRQDPYTGTTFIYDYLVCRNGIKVSDKYNNLVLHFPRIQKNVWNAKNPNDPNTKSCNWYLTANMLLFTDGYDLIRG